MLQSASKHWMASSGSLAHRSLRRGTDRNDVCALQVPQPQQQPPVDPRQAVQDPRLQAPQDARQQGPRSQVSRTDVSQDPVLASCWKPSLLGRHNSGTMLCECKYDNGRVAGLLSAQEWDCNPHASEWYYGGMWCSDSLCRGNARITAALCGCRCSTTPGRWRSQARQASS